MNKLTSQQLVLDSSLKGYFYDRLTDLNKSSLMPIPPEMLNYSSMVLEKFADSGAFFENDNGRMRDKILGLKLLETSQLASREKQKENLRDIGDTSLFLCGYFGTSFSKKAVDSGYYKQIGMSAYAQLDSLSPEFFNTKSFFANLSRIFSPLASLISLVSLQHIGPEDILNLYDDWIESGSGEAYEKLRGLGITLEKGPRKIS